MLNSVEDLPHNMFVSEINRLPVTTKRIEFGKWDISYRQSHILASICSTLEKCAENEESACQLCQYNKALNFPHLPDMVFPNNILSLVHSGGGRIDFDCLNALKCVDIGKLPVQVACAGEWQETRPMLEHKAKSFDWTFTTDYKGTISGGLELSPTEQEINRDLLKTREAILFYHDLSLFEDELHDHGIASCSVKIRVMPSSWFILLRYFLRVDDVMARINDTRMFYQLNSDHVLIEYTSREGNIPDLKVPNSVLIEPTELSAHLPLKSQILHKINLPSNNN